LTPVSRKVVTEPNEFPILRKICEMLLQGYSFNGKCTELNRLGYRTRLGNEWAIHNIHSILDSPVIRGHIEVKWSNGEETIARDSHQAAITEGEYQQIQSLLQKRVEQYSNLNEAPAHFLQGLIRCSTCGFSMPIQANKFSHFENGVRIFHENGNYRYYVRKCRTKGCNNYGCSVKIVEDIIEDTLKEYSEQVQEKIALLREINVEEITAQTVAKRKELEAAITKLDSKESGLLDLLLDNTIDKSTYNKRIQALKDNKADLIHELQSIPTLDVKVIAESAENQFNLIQEYEQLDGADKRRLLQMLFAKILYKRPSKDVSPIINIYPN
jgi:site-specific DNA recombinase